MPATQTYLDPCKTATDRREEVYIPSPEEIREACAAIQATWTEAERARRARGQAGRTRIVSVTPKRFAKLLLDRSAHDGWAA